MQLDRRPQLKFWLAWLSAALFAWLVLDPIVSPMVLQWGRLDGTGWTAWILRRPGHYSGALFVASAVLILHAQHWRAWALVAGTGAAAGLSVATFKWVIGRSRPDFPSGPYSFEPFANGFHALIYDRGHLSTPSGDTTMAFAIGASLTYLWPRYRWLFLAIATVVGLERIWENVHYPSDVVLGALVAILWAGCLARLLLKKSPATLPATERSGPETNGDDEHG